MKKAILIALIFGGHITNNIIIIIISVLCSQSSLRFTYVFISFFDFHIFQLFLFIASADSHLLCRVFLCAYLSLTMCWALCLKYYLQKYFTVQDDFSFLLQSFSVDFCRHLGASAAWDDLNPILRFAVFWTTQNS